MDVTYGEGEFQEGDIRCQGKVILSEHKLYLTGPRGDLTQTYIPLEKIEGLKKTSKVLYIHVNPTLTLRYTALIKLKKDCLNDLLQELVARRGFKKKFLRNEWVEIPR